MRVVFYIFLFIFSLKARSDATTNLAFKQSQIAFFSYPSTRKFRKDTEKYLFSFIPMEKDKVAIVAGVGFALTQGNISTKNFSNLKVNLLGWDVSPELNLNFRSGQTYSLIKIGKEF